MGLIGEWRTLLQREFEGYDRNRLLHDTLAGVTVAAVALPLALAFGVASGADAASGLVTAILSGLVIGLLGGAPYQISGPTGAMSAVLVLVASRHGLPALWATGLMAGALLVVLGLFRLGRVVSLIPAPVITGFTSGIAVLIAFGQIDNALGVALPPTESVVDKLLVLATSDLHPNAVALGTTLAVVIVTVWWPRLPLPGRLPGALVGIVVATVAMVIGGWDVPTIGSVPRSLLLADRLRFGTIPWEGLAELVIPALSVAALGAVESLLCGAVGGNMTGIRLHSSVELVAQGVGNMLIPFFGGVPATAAIARTSVNIKSGGVTRAAPVIHGIVLLGVALLFAPLLEKIPLAALAGVLLVTAWKMNDWAAIRFFFSKRLRHAIAAFLATLSATVVLDLTQAIVIGFGLSTMIFMAQMSDLVIVRQGIDPGRLEAAGHRFLAPEGSVAVYTLTGPLFFAAARKLIDEVEAHDGGETHLILSLRGVPLVDATGLEVLHELLDRQRRGGGSLLLAGLQMRVDALLRRVGFLDELGEERVFWSADRAILSLGRPLPGKPSLAPPLEGLVEEIVLATAEVRDRRDSGG